MFLAIKIFLIDSFFYFLPVQGFFDLFRLPLQQYNKDGRIMRGFQLGAQSFSARTALAALEITSRIIHLLQVNDELRLIALLVHVVNMTIFCLSVFSLLRKPHLIFCL